MFSQVSWSEPSCIQGPLNAGSTSAVGQAYSGRRSGHRCGCYNSRFAYGDGGVYDDGCADSDWDGRDISPRDLWPRRNQTRTGPP